MQEYGPKVIRFLRSYRTTLILLIPVALYYLRFIRRPGGMTDYPLGAECMLNEQSLSVCSLGFTYPPVFYFLMIPFTFLPLWLRHVVWYVLSVSALYYSFRLCEYLTKRTFAIQFEAKELLWFRIVSFTVSLKFILSVLENQSNDYLVFFFVVLGIYGLVERNDISASFGISVGAALKATPLIFFPYALFKRRWKVFAGCMVFFIFLSFLPDVFFTPKDANTGYFVSWVQGVVKPALSGTSSPAGFAFWEGENVLNQSLRSFVYRIAVVSNLQAAYKKILFLVYGVFLVFIGSLLHTSSKLKDSFVLDGSVLLITMLLLSPMSSKSHFVALMLPYMVTVGYLMKQGSFRNLLGVLLVLSFALNSLTSQDIIGKKASLAMLYMGSITIGTGLLLIMLAVIISAEVRRNTTADGEEPGWRTPRLGRRTSEESRMERGIICGEGGAQRTVRA